MREAKCFFADSTAGDLVAGALAASRSLTIGGIGAVVSYSGLAPGFAGASNSVTIAVQ